LGVWNSGYVLASVEVVLVAMTLFGFKELTLFGFKELILKTYRMIV
jgi:hypothetical protein